MLHLSLRFLPSSGSGRSDVQEEQQMEFQLQQPTGVNSFNLVVAQAGCENPPQRGGSGWWSLVPLVFPLFLLCFFFASYKNNDVAAGIRSRGCTKRVLTPAT